MIELSIKTGQADRLLSPPTSSRMRARLIAAHATWAVSFLLLVGCSGTNHPQTVPVSGQVLFGGKAVEGAHVTFLGNSGQKPAYGTTDAEGRFRLSTFEPGDGAEPGDYRVTVKKFEDVNGGSGNAQVERSMEEEARSPLPPPVVRPALPEQYADPASSGLTQTVTPDGPNAVVFQLSVE